MILEALLLGLRILVISVAIVGLIFIDLWFVYKMDDFCIDYGWTILIILISNIFILSFFSVLFRGLF